VTNRWFADNVQPVWEQKLLPLTAQMNPQRYLEIGVCEGQSMTWMLATHNAMLGTGVDPFVDPRGRKPEAFAAYKQRFLGNMQRLFDNQTLNAVIDGRIIPAEVLNAMHNRGTASESCEKASGYAIGRLRLHVGSSQDWLASMCHYGGNRDLFDLVYIDGDHECAPALVDMLLAWRLLKPGGIMLLDDCHRRWNVGRPKTQEATESFLKAMEDRYYIEFREPDNVNTPRMYGLRKRKNRGWL
jgi:predicted O-methyltransferase YrrM